MRTGKFLRKIIYAFILAVIFGCSSATAFAESTVYIFMGTTAHESKVFINGKEAFDMIGPIKKTFEADGGQFKIPLNFYHAVKRKCVLKGEGKVLLSFDLKYTHPGNLKVSHMAAEIQLNLEDGSVHYLEIDNVGLKGGEFKEIPEKKVKKYMENKKYKELPDFIEQ